MKSSSVDVEVKGDVRNYRSKQTKTCKNILEEWAETTSAHGFPFLFTNIRLWKKITWGLMIIAVTSYCFYSKILRFF